ncbi:MAG: hypothetical protein WC123_07280 [Bacilli bacterium]
MRKTLAEQFTDLSEKIFGRKIDFVQQLKEEKKYQNRVKLNKKVSDNSNIKGYSYRKVCDVAKAVLPDSYKINENRLDAPCDICINFQCPYSFGKIIRW